MEDRAQAGRGQEQEDRGRIRADDVYPAGLVELRRITEQGLAIRRFGQNERLGDSTIRRFGYCGWSA